MSQVTTDQATAQGRQAGPPGAARPRPLSPHLQVWRWHVTMAASIATRASGVALYVGALILAGLLLALASGPDAYSAYAGALHSPLGLVALFGVTTALFYHLAAGVRHLFWDAGKGFQPRTADITGLVAFGVGIVGAVVVFALAFMTGAI